MRDVPPPQRPSTAEFRKLMGQFTTGVCVVAVDAGGGTGEGKIAAMTINSFVSVSLEPMLVCWSLHNSSSQFDLFAGAGEFAVSILAHDQAELAQRYATRADTGLNTADFTRSAAGLPVIESAVGHFECRQWDMRGAGDHTMILGEVIGMSPQLQDGASSSPLGFFNGKFFSIGQ